ncbi:hypothetical protein CL629_01580 [bacterium]|nr:hypothetical protein [bacterium]
MTTETKKCANCNTDFQITPDDLDFYEKVKTPPPTWCPECRLVRRMTFRNERSLYKRTCDLCKKEKIFMYHTNAPYTVYCKECWWSDTWDPKSYAKEYNPSKPFFKQFKELLHAVPRPGTIQQGNNTDSEYTNRVTDMRNCYLVFGAINDEFCKYSVWLNDSKECMDCYNVQKSEQCYECIDCVQCYQTAFSEESSNCIDSWFLMDCINCQNCFGCVNLRNKNYCIWNKQYSKEEYEKMVQPLRSGSALTLAGIHAKFQDFRKQFIVPAISGHRNKNVSGNWIENSKNLRDSFSSLDVEDGRYCFAISGAKDVMDYTYWGKESELIYEAVNIGIQCSNVAFAHECWSGLTESQYVMNCHNSKNLFGCIGLQNAEYYILNKKYSKEEYEKLVPEIIEQMNAIPYTDTKEKKYRYGEFFPFNCSPHAYNESLSQEFFPLSKNEIEKQGYQWNEPETKNYKISLPTETLPDNIENAPTSITKDIIGCEHGGKCTHQCTTAFRILPEELQMYKNASLPLPRLCPNCRHYARLAKRTPLKLWHRQCVCDYEVYKNSAKHEHHPEGRCTNEFETSYDPERKEIVYCETCYQKEVA